MDDPSIKKPCMDVRTFIDLWPTRAALAADVELETPGLKLSKDAVHKWARGNSIPAKYHYSVLQAAAHRGFSVDALRLAEMHAAKSNTHHTTEMDDPSTIVSRRIEAAE